MRYKALLFFTAMLFCFAALLYALSSTAFAGQGCGSNWMGDTTGDSDFYVSKNQNLGTSGVDSSGAASAAAKPALALGSTAIKASQMASIQSLTPDKSSPQAPGTTIVWTATASNPGNGELLYDFLLNGPSTGGQPKDETGWIAENTWTWNVTNESMGENQVEVRVKRASSQDSEGSKAVSYVIAAASDINSILASETSGVTVIKPRYAPDEKRPTITDDISGPNMKMPDTKPIPLVQSGSAENTQQVQQAATNPEPAEPEVMEVDGKWNVKLGNSGSTMDLILIQTGKSVNGMGSLYDQNENQNEKLSLIVTGTVSTDSMTLNAKTVVSEYGNKIDKRFNLDLVKADRDISGSYEAFSGEILTGNGKATASRFG